MKNSKPYFGKEVEDKIVSVIGSELAKENKKCDEEELRRYVQAPKNTYENAILSGVAEGIYLATIQGKEVAYKVKSPGEQEIDAIIASAKGSTPTANQVSLALKNMRASKLSHALNMVALYGSCVKLELEAVSTEGQQ